MDIGTGDGLMPWVWLAVAVALTLLEARWLGWKLRALPFAVSALAAWLLGLGGVGVPVQGGVVVLGGVVLLVVVQRYRSLVAEGSRLPPGVGATRLVGVTAHVLDDVDAGPAGTVRLAGETWHARSDDGSLLPEGTLVQVVDVEGTRLLVARPTRTSEDTAPDPGASTRTEG